MTKLDDALDWLKTEAPETLVDDAKQEIKALIMELIGDFNPIDLKRPYPDNLKASIQAELHQKVKEL